MDRCSQRPAVPSKWDAGLTARTFDDNAVRQAVLTAAHAKVGEMVVAHPDYATA